MKTPDTPAARTPASQPPAPVPGHRLVLVSHGLCPYVQRAVIALREKGVAFERIDIDLSDKPAWFLALSPLGKTPVLLVPGAGRFQAVFESAAICEYLDETQGPALHPAEPLERARHRAWVEVASATLDLVWRYYTARNAAALEACRQELAARFAQLERALSPGPWFGGDRFALVDAAFAPVFRYFEVFDSFHPTHLIAAHTKLGRWARALSARASVRAAVSPAYGRALREFVERQQGELGRISSLATTTPTIKETP